MAKTAKKLKIIPLGGVGEIGKNMTVIEYGSDIIIVDCGMSFPDEEMPGIDVVIPDMSYIEKNAANVRGILITHGHEDHIGAVPYALQKLNVPVYATKLTIALIEQKLTEIKVDHADLNCVSPGDTIRLGCFSVEFIKTSHSIAGACALAIHTPDTHRRLQGGLYAYRWGTHRYSAACVLRLPRGTCTHERQHQRGERRTYTL